MDREALSIELDSLLQKVKTSNFINPNDMRRIEEIKSLLITNGNNKELVLQLSKPKRLKRVTSFTKHRT